LEQRFRSVHKTESAACNQLNQLIHERKRTSRGSQVSRGAHEAVERGRVHSHGSRDLLCCLGTAHELLGQAQLRGGGQCLCDELAGDEMHKHRRWRHSVVHCVLLSWVSDSHEKFGGSAGASLDYKVYDVVASTSKDAELALKDNQDRIRDTILPKGGNNDNNAACLGGRQLMVSYRSQRPKQAISQPPRWDEFDLRRNTQHRLPQELHGPGPQAQIL
jgi:hypothetical protein